MMLLAKLSSLDMTKAHQNTDSAATARTDLRATFGVTQTLKLDILWIKHDGQSLA